MRTMLHLLNQRLDAWRFAGYRADYLEYLHAVLLGSQGRLTIRELFDRDARRHGKHSVRGRLAAQWSRTCEAAGGDLYTTWRGYLPADELALIRAAQAFGNAHMLACFEALSRHLGLLLQTRRMLWFTLGSAFAACLLISFLLLALPVFTVPSLQQTFAGLPQVYYGQWSRALFGFAAQLRRWGFLLPLLMISGAGLALHQLPYAHGRWRQTLDRYGPWRLYRQVQALRLLSLIAILLRPQTGRSSQLRPVIVLFLPDARPWLAGHLRQILRRIDQGNADVTAFATGLLDPDLYWYLSDMALANGLPQALQATHARMAGQWFARIQRQARMLRWLALLGGLAFVLFVALWHFAAIDELRRGWMMFHAAGG